MKKKNSQSTALNDDHSDSIIFFNVMVVQNVG